MKRHPEERPNERFLGNGTPLSDRLQLDLKRFKTMRLGNQAYCVFGTKLDSSHRPIFISEDEYPKWDAYKVEQVDRIRGS